MMSIHDLKTRMPDVAGIEALTMSLEAGRIVLRWGDGCSATVDAPASVADCELAVRRAIQLPPLSVIPHEPAPLAAPAWEQVTDDWLKLAEAFEQEDDPSPPAWADVA